MVGWVYTAQDAVSIVSTTYLLSSMSYLGRVPSFSTLNRPVITSPLMLTKVHLQFPHLSTRNVKRVLISSTQSTAVYICIGGVPGSICIQDIYRGPNWPTFICIGECNGGHVDISVRVILRPSVGLLLRRYDQNPITGCSYWVKTNVASS